MTSFTRPFVVLGPVPILSTAIEEGIFQSSALGHRPISRRISCHTRCLRLDFRFEGPNLEGFAARLIDVVEWDGIFSNLLLTEI